MAKQKIENYQELYTKSQLRRMKVVDEYLNNFGELIEKKAISPNCVIEALAKKYELSRAGVKYMLKRAGVYKSGLYPICYPTDAERASKPTYFFCV